MVLSVAVPELKLKFDFAAVIMVAECDKGLEITLHGGVIFLWPDYTYEQWVEMEKKLLFQMRMQQQQQ